MKRRKLTFKESIVDLKKDFHLFVRIVRSYVLPYMHLVILSIVFSLLVALCFGGSIASLKPLLDNLVEPNGFEEIVHNEYLLRYAPMVSKFLVYACEPENSSGILTPEMIKMQRKKNLFTVLLIGVITILVFQYVFKFFEEFLIGIVVERVSRDLSKDLYAHLQQMDIGYINNTGVSQFISNFTNDVMYVNKGIKTLFGKVVGEPLKAICAIVVVFMIDFWMALIAFTIVPFIFVFIYSISRRIKKHTKSYLKRRGNLVSLISDTLYATRVVQVFCMEPHELKRFKYENDKTYQSNIKILFYDALSSPTIVITSSLVGGIVIWFAGLKLVDGTMTSGSFFAFYAAIGALSDPVRKLSNVFNRLQGAIVASKNVFKILDTPSKIQEVENPLELPEFKGSIEFQSVSFSYEGSKKILSDIKLEVKRGEMIAIVGKSGAGKSTLVNLIPRFYDCTGGKILIDGLDIKELQLKELRKLIGIVTQETLLFNSTIFDNIRYGVPESKDEDIIEASKKANVHEFVMDTEKQYETVIGEQGLQLSGGQRQRLSIARAILKDPQILILDEAASSLDTINEQKILEALEKFMINRTTFVIAHRLSTIVKANKIIVLKNGAVVGQGNHQELLKENKEYQELYRKQFAESFSEEENSVEEKNETKLETPAQNTKSVSTEENLGQEEKNETKLEDSTQGLVLENSGIEKSKNEEEDSSQNKVTKEN